MTGVELPFSGIDALPGAGARLSPPARRVGDRQTGVVVCRGCCCGNAERDPGIDHGGQLLRLQRFAQARPAQVLMRTTDCLGPCEQANVVVVRPSAAGRRRGGRPVWLGLVRDEGAVDLIEAWVSAGGPGLAPPPAPLTLHVIPAPKPVRSDRVR